MTMVVLLVTTAGSLLAQNSWICDVMANLRVQQCLALVSLFAICLVLQQWRWLAMVGCCLLIHSPWCLAELRNEYEVSGRSKPIDDSIVITMANVLTSNRSYDEILVDVLSRNPDAFVILELSNALADRIREEVGVDYPHAIAVPMDEGNFGIGLYSRYPLSAVQRFKLNTEIESIEASIEVGGEMYRIIATHPFPPLGSRGFQLRNGHLSDLADRIGQINNDVTPTIVVGDLNVTPWSPHFRSFADKTGLRRATDGFDTTPTWYRFAGFPFGLVLDHVLISEQLHCGDHSVGPEMGSDHRSVTVSVALAPRK